MIEGVDVAVRLVSELGWTTEQAAATRHKLAAWAEDWNDPAMDVYDLADNACSPSIAYRPEPVERVMQRYERSDWDFVGGGAKP